MGSKCCGISKIDPSFLSGECIQERECPIITKINYYESRQLMTIPNSDPVQLTATEAELQKEYEQREEEEVYANSRSRNNSVRTIVSVESLMTKLIRHEHHFNVFQPSLDNQSLIDRLEDEGPSLSLFAGLSRIEINRPSSYNESASAFKAPAPAAPSLYLSQNINSNSSPNFRVR